MMGRYLDALRNSENTAGGNLINLNNPDEVGNLGSLGTHPGTFQKTEPIVSRWWRVHFADRDPLETCFDPAVEAE